MPQPTPWNERRFAADLPLAMFPNVLERLRGAPPRLAERLSGLDGKQLVRRLGESWSILENAAHLVQVEAIWIGRLDDFARGLPELRPADSSHQRPAAAASGAASANGAAGEGEEAGAIAAAFARARAQFVARLEALGEADLSRTALHPRLRQPMRVLDHMLFAAEHDDHHLARISELRRLLAG